MLGVDVGWVNGNYQRILFHSVRTASADRVRRMAAPRRHLALVCWESALFLKVRDEIQTGNLAIDGAKNFGRFEDLLPACRAMGAGP